MLGHISGFYLSIFGSLLWIARGTRPDISFVVAYLSQQFCNRYSEEHFKALIRVRLHGIPPPLRPRAYIHQLQSRQILCVRGLPHLRLGSRPLLSSFLLRQYRLFLNNALISARQPRNNTSGGTHELMRS
eukprot:2096980-Pyramimonas_sp.AAC.1